jgi:hypothetical protein
MELNADIPHQQPAAVTYQEGLRSIMLRKEESQETMMLR